MPSSKLPSAVIWDMTYACPLRCTHCYSESGRRPSRQLPLDKALRVAEAIVAMRPKTAYFSGGEPLLLKGLPQIAEKFSAAGIPIQLYTSGFGVDDESAAWLGRLFSRIHVSVDGADAATHDYIRGMAGAFDTAMRALSSLEKLALQSRESASGSVSFGIDFTVVRSNFNHVERVVSDIASRFPHLGFIFFGTAFASGLASRKSYAELELCTDEERVVLRDADFAARLRARGGAGREIDLFDALGPNPEIHGLVVSKSFRRFMQIEPDGGVRGIPQYEGIVGNILEDSAEVIWARAKERQRDPFVVRELSGVRTMKDWATAVRNIERRFASSKDLVRISRRKEYPG
jgi:MoaA/NifB/PqqE/SkfB family radical SAM enzyme